MSLALALGPGVAAIAQVGGAAVSEIRLASGERAFVLAAAPAREGSALLDVMVHRVLAAPRSVYGVPGTHSMRIAYRLNCTTRQWSIREVLLYPDRTQNGPPLRHIDVSSQSFTYPPLESDPLASAAFGIACSPTAVASGPAAPTPFPATGDDSTGMPRLPVNALPVGTSTTALPATSNRPTPGALGTPSDLSTTAASAQTESPPKPQASSGVPPRTETRDRDTTVDTAPPWTTTRHGSPANSDTAPSLAPDRDPEAGPKMSPPLSSGTVSITGARPFFTLPWTLGTLSSLAHYAYTDPHTHRARGAALDVLNSLLQLHQQPVGDQPASSGSTLPWTMLRLAIDKGLQDGHKYERDAQAKASFLAASGLVEAAPPGVVALLETKRNAPMLAGLRVEFYRRNGADDYAIVFRGSAQAEDWVTNLWLGVDLGGVDAPYYQSAREIVAQFRTEVPSARIVLVGHSLGGGMAQYVGAHLQLHVVAFNSSPLPPSYILTSDKAQEGRTRVYSAVYKMRRFGVTAPDPISISVAWAAQSNFAYSIGARATQHLVRPICTLTRPEPDLNEEERRVFVEQAAAAMATPSILSKLGLINSAVGDMPHEVTAALLKADSRWAAAYQRHGLQVPLVGSRLLDHASRKTFAVQSGLLSASEIGAQAIFKRHGALALNLSLKAAAFGVRSFGATLMQLHSMGRYMRGLEYVSVNDSFGDFSNPQKTDLVTKCDGLELGKLF